MHSGEDFYTALQRAEKLRKTSHYPKHIALLISEMRLQACVWKAMVPSLQCLIWKQFVKSWERNVYEYNLNP